MADEATRKTVSDIPVLKTNAGPRDRELWVQRLKEEYLALIKYVENNKTADNDWFRLESNKEGTKWFGKCWHIHELLKYEFDVEFDEIKQESEKLASADQTPADTAPADRIYAANAPTARFVWEEYPDIDPREPNWLQDFTRQHGLLLDSTDYQLLD
ncbi:UFC1 enzyme, partial [Polypterus senegalus]